MPWYARVASRPANDGGEGSLQPVAHQPWHHMPMNDEATGGMDVLGVCRARHQSHADGMWWGPVRSCTVVAPTAWLWGPVLHTTGISHAQCNVDPTPHNRIALIILSSLHLPTQARMPSVSINWSSLNQGPSQRGGRLQTPKVVGYEHTPCCTVRERTQSVGSSAQLHQSAGDWCHLGWLMMKPWQTPWPGRAHLLPQIIAQVNQPHICTGWHRRSGFPRPQKAAGC